MAREYAAKGMEVYSREIKVRLTRAGVDCEEMYVYSREINWDTSGLDENLELRCILGWRFWAIHRDGYHLMNSDVFWYVDIWRYIGNGLYWPIPMYILDRFEVPYIGMGIEISIPMYRLLKPE